ncbi:MAG: hypothetical protein L0Z50_11535 [Verrucomicrobiales bacterium]|nr:hypothetical protein [Verrucomicrobiales bacterium]
MNATEETKAITAKPAPAASSIQPDPLTNAALFASLPPPWPHDPLPAIRRALAVSGQKVVVLDDDPTGTQTVQDTPVLTEWPVEALARELISHHPVFYLLTNSRSLPPDDAAALNLEIARHLTEASRRTGRSFVVVSRSDSTLRGHFPVETDALAHALNLGLGTCLLIPFFEAGGRFTVGDVHYVTEGGALVPAGEAAFARDDTFGYRASNLREWVEEKTGGRILARQVTSISIEDIRCGGPDRVCKRLMGLTGVPMCVVNAAAHRDLEVFVQGLLAAEKQGRRFLYRSAASFVAARAGLVLRPLLNTSELSLPASGPELIIAGSHVPQSSEQLIRLLRAVDELASVEIKVPELQHKPTRAKELGRVRRAVDDALRAGRKTLVYTSRRLIAGADATESLAISRHVSDALVEVAQSVSVRPRYIIAKGGITSSDIATRGLGVKRAMVRGQLLPRVPVWELGPETHFPGLIYVVFPGNVGGPDALVEAVHNLQST